jgi:phage shock protein PspC (stress-responsive transcriptional regulator)
MEYEIDTKLVIALFIFIVVGIILFSPIISYVNQVTSPGSYTTVGTTSSFVSNPYYAGPTGATLVSLVPIFYILVMIAVPGIIVYKMVKG